MTDFWKLSSVILVADVLMIKFFGCIRYLNSRQKYFGKIVDHARKWVEWQKWMSNMNVNTKVKKNWLFFYNL
jgi:hypothetical protein